jgi:hypothetical protein
MAIPWTSDRIDALRRKIVDERKPSNIVAQELTREFGFVVSRSAVMGKVFRLGLQVANARPKRQPKPSAVMAVRDFECRWIENNEFCGRPTVHARSWCEEHRRRVFL